MGMLGGGLRLLEDGKISTFSDARRPVRQRNLRHRADDQDRLWMACSKGIFSVPRAICCGSRPGELKKSPALPTVPPMRCA